MLIRLDVVAVMFNVAGLAPVAVAVIVDEPDATPFMVNEPVVLLCAIVTSAGDTLTNPALLLARWTARPPAGAGSANVIVPVRLRPTPMSALGAPSVMLRRLTFTLAVPSWNPAAVAVMIVPPATDPVVTIAVPVDAPSAMTIDGSMAATGSLLARVTLWPPTPAG